MGLFKRAGPLKKISSNKRSGQALLEYVLLMSALSVLAIGFAKFMGEQMFSSSLQNGRLPSKVGICVSHEKATAGDCR